MRGRSVKDTVELIARRRSDGLKFPASQAHVDPDDTRELLRHFDSLVRQHDRRSGHPRDYLPEYDLIVRAPGRSEFVVASNGTEF